jgi:chitin synthase
MISVQGYVYFIKDNTLNNAFKREPNGVNFDQTFNYERNYDLCRGVGGVISTFTAPCGACRKANVDFTEATSLNLEKAIYDFYAPNIPKNTEFTMVLDGAVVDLDSYFKVFPTPVTGDELDTALRYILKNRAPESKTTLLTDGTRDLMKTRTLSNAIPCVKAVFTIGYIGGKPVSCVVYDYLNYFFLVVVLVILAAKFTMATLFAWVVAPKLSRKPSSKKKALWIPGKFPPPDCLHPHGRVDGPFLKSAVYTEASHSTTSQEPAKVHSKPNASESSPYIVMLVTAYSENTDALELTLKSMATTSYPDDRKCFFIVADGEGIKGKGNSKPTPELILDLLELDPTWGPKQLPYAYKAVALGALQYNMAKVYVGHYG